MPKSYLLPAQSSYASPPPPPAASSLLVFSSPPRTDVAPWRLPDAFDVLPDVRLKGVQSSDPLPLKKKKKNRAAQAERVRKLQLVESCS